MSMHDEKMVQSLNGQLQQYDKPEQHPAYNDALRSAAKRAWDSRMESTSPKGFYPPQFGVYFDGSAMYVRAIEAAPPEDSKLVCIAQFFGSTTVQLRFSGARSEWIDF